MPDPPPAPGRTTTPQSWVWGFGHLAVHAYYRVERLGGALPDGALLLVANHPNTLLDPAVIQTTAGRRIRFLAKSTLFAGHPLSPLIRRSGAIPVYRKIDPGVDTSRNVEMFAAVEASLADGEAICLFPEGISHAGGRLEPLRTGAARMVLDNCAAGRPVTVVPVGLNFDALARFRSRVTTVFRPFGGLRGPRGELRRRRSGRRASPHRPHRAAAEAPDGRSGTAARSADRRAHRPPLRGRPRRLARRAGATGPPPPHRCRHGKAARTGPGAFRRSHGAGRGAPRQPRAVRPPRAPTSSSASRRPRSSASRSGKGCWRCCSARWRSRAWSSSPRRTG